MADATWDDDELVWKDFDEVVADRPMAYCLSIESEYIWLPKSQIKVDLDDGIVGIPKWLAEAKGLIQ